MGNISAEHRYIVRLFPGQVVTSLFLLKYFLLQGNRNTTKMSSSPSSNDPQKIDFHPTDTREDTLRKIRTADSVAIPLDVFEKLYLNPQQPASGHLRKTFGNPTPVALVGFLVAATPNSIALMGWRGAGGGGGALLCSFIFFGGMLQIIGGTMEWVLGNTFSSVLFFTYGT